MHCGFNIQDSIFISNRLLGYGGRQPATSSEAMVLRPVLANGLPFSALSASAESVFFEQWDYS